MEHRSDPVPAGTPGPAPSITEGTGEPVTAGAASGPPFLSARLYNRDLAPTKKEGRTWSAYNIFALWANDVHSLGSYGFALSLFAMGLGGWQILLSLGIGAVLLFVLLTVSGVMGFRTGVPFPVLSRISFGIRGAQLPAVIRGVVAIIWFGIQTYLATLAMRVLAIALWPPLAAFDANSVLGLSTLGWVSFLLLWTVQVVIARYGMETIRRYEAYAGPVILVTFVGLAGWVLVRTGGSIAWTAPDALTGGPMWRLIFAGASLWVAIYATFLLNYCDFTRSSKSRASIVNGNLWGILLNILFFACLTVVFAGGGFRINGQVLSSPADLVATIPNTLLLVLAGLALLVMTVAVNLMANFVAPIYVLVNLVPKRLNFARASVLTAIIGLAILPWNLYNNPAVIAYFVGGLGALLGPLFGVVAADYWIVRRGRVNVPDLYTESPAGTYAYSRGVNPTAIAAFVPAAVVALVIAFVPIFEPVSPFSWFVAVGIAGAIYCALDRRRGQFADVSGEDIAVES